LFIVTPHGTPPLAVVATDFVFVLAAGGIGPEKIQIDRIARSKFSVWRLAAAATENGMPPTARNGLAVP